MAEFLRHQESRGLRPRSIVKQRECLQTFVRWLAPKPIAQATREDVVSFLDARPIGPRTRYSYLSHFHVFFTWAVETGRTAEDPTLGVPRPKLRRLLPRPAATDDLQRAIAQATPKFRCWIVLAAYQGLRCQEIAGLRREDVLDTEGLLRVTQAKGGNERVLPLHPTVLAGLQALPMPRVGYVFRRTQGGPYNGRTLSVEFNAFLRSAQADCTAHQLRHWFGTTLYSMTKDLRLTQEMMGHASPTTTAIYTAFDREAATHAVSALSMEK